MGAEPRDFQCATPMEIAAPAAEAEAEVDPSQINLFAGDHVDLGSSPSAWSGKSVRDFVRFGDVGWIRSFRNIVGEFRLPDTVRSLLIAGGVVVAFGLGWSCASIFNLNSDASLDASDASLAPPVQRADVSRGKPDAEKQALRHHHHVATAAATLRPISGESNRPKPLVATASARASSSGMAQIERALQNVPQRSTQERTASFSDTDRPLVAVPDTKPTTIPGWTVRDVYGETAVLAGPDHVWTVKTGDNVPGVGRVDSIVRWGNRWIVATSAGLISTE